LAGGTVNVRVGDKWDVDLGAAFGKNPLFLLRVRFE
jgi:hypothetical protein